MQTYMCMYMYIQQMRPLSACEASSHACVHVPVQGGLTAEMYSLFFRDVLRPDLLLFEQAALRAAAPTAFGAAAAWPAAAAEPRPLSPRHAQAAGRRSCRRPLRST